MVLNEIPVPVKGVKGVPAPEYEVSTTIPNIGRVYYIKFVIKGRTEIR